MSSKPLCKLGRCGNTICKGLVLMELPSHCQAYCTVGAFNQAPWRRHGGTLACNAQTCHLYLNYTGKLKSSCLRGSLLYWYMDSRPQRHAVLEMQMGKAARGLGLVRLHCRIHKQTQDFGPLGTGQHGRGRPKSQQHPLTKPALYEG
jgi:hypothetical protein